MNLSRYIISITAICFLINPDFSLAQEDIQFTFTQNDACYSFKSSFDIHVDPNCLLNICFDFEHIKALAPDAKEVSLLDTGKNWNKIRYTYQKFAYFENTSIWYRTSDESTKRVDFQLISSVNNSTIMPVMISSTGYYQIKTRNNKVNLEYFQECKLTDSFLTTIYLSRVEKNAKQFIYRLYDYINVICKDSD